MRRLLPVLTLAVFSALPVVAWNDAGHMTVAAVAYQHLTPQVRTRVDTLLRQHPDFAKLSEGLAANDPNFGLRVFMKAATWPDFIRNDPRFYDDLRPDATPTPPLPGFPDMKIHKNWHYRDEGISFDGTATKPPDAVNALTEIVAQRSALGDPAVPASTQAYGLSWLAHLIGDVHQPLHAVSRFSALHPGGDHGGNEFHLDDPSDPKLSLHWFWDTALAADPDPQKAIALAKSIAGDYVRDDRELAPGADPPAMVLAWLEESAALARYVVYTVAEERAQPPFPKVPEAYRTLANQIARHRAAVAGYRLAALINDRLRGS
ncbi:MAG TPA: S1/P1 nuclease [Thermoanaerobaculia bacterium]|nr:S1/P1 nuclease [Thermoanaerobaculia bacterium]